MPFSDRENLRAVAPSPATSNPYGLSSGEFNVARMMGQGLGLAEIAEALGITGRSVHAQRERLMLKLRARNLAHLEHIIATLVDFDSDWSEAVTLDDSADDHADFEDLIFVD